MIQVKKLRGRGSLLGEAIRWAPLGPGGDPQMSLQGRRRGRLAAYGDRVNLAEVIRWAPLGPGGDPRMSLQGLRGSAVSYGDYGNVVKLRGFSFPATFDEINWAQIGMGALVGWFGYQFAKKRKYIK